MNLKQQRKEAYEAAMTLISKQKSGTNLTAAEVTELTGLVEQVKSLDVQIKQSDEANAAFNALAGSGDESGGHEHLDFKGLGVKIAQSSGGIKAWTAPGYTQTAVPVSDTIQALHTPLPSFLEALGVEPVGGRLYEYRRQVTRTNNAAPVAPGELKPTSIYTFDKVEGRLKVVAHLSEPVDKYFLKDEKGLANWIQAELVYGLMLALENQVLNGNGTGENFTGLNNTSGIQTVAYAGSKLATTRKAITALETLPIAPHVFAMNPTEWEAIELLTTTTGEYLLNPNSPIDRATRRLWGVPVALSNAVPAGTGWLLGNDCAGVVVNREDGAGMIDVEWGMVSDDFARNQVRARAEMRADLAVVRPDGVVKLALAE